MAIENVALVNIIGKMESLDKTLMKIAKSELFHLEKADITSKTKNFQKLNEKNPYSETLDKIKKIFKILKISPHFNDYSSLNFKKIAEINQLISEYFKTVSEKTKLLAELTTKISSMEKELQQLKQIESFGPNFYKIFNTSFVNSCFGKINYDTFIKLECFNNFNFFFIPLENDQNFYLGLFIYSKTDQSKFEEMAKSIYFEQYYSSNQIKTNPSISIKKIEAELKNLKSQVENLSLEIENFKSQHTQNLLCIYSKIKTLHTTFIFRQFVVSNNNFFYINGFVLEKNLNEFTNLFDELSDVMVEVVESKSRKQKTNLKAPVKLKTFALFKPFELLIETFGLPTYGTTNPTSFIGLVYCFLFGLMFGDVGQGGCLFVAGAAFWLWKKNVLGLILTRCAFSSCVFGLIYDSCFGFEGLFENFWKSFKVFSKLPFNLLKGKNAVTILIVSLILGMILINIAILKNILISLKNKKYRQATLSGNGLAGFSIYGSITAEAISILVFKTNILSPLVLILTIFIPICLIFLEQPISNFLGEKILKKEQTAKTEFNFLNSALETFETVLNYFTNTLSFLRVGGFAMSHAALMLVVVKFCEKCSNVVASPLIAIFGNVFVIALEGMVVSIQVLRLIYYEIFSRFYQSNGKKFEPAKIIF